MADEGSASSNSNDLVMVKEEPSEVECSIVDPLSIDSQMDRFVDVSLQELDEPLNIETDLRLQPEAKKDENCGFECKVCNKRFNLKSSRNRHIKTVHHETPSMECDICNKTFVNAVLFDQHIYSHYSLSYHCKHCDMSFKKKSELSLHLKAHSEEALTNSQSLETIEDPTDVKKDSTDNNGPNKDKACISKRVQLKAKKNKKKRCFQCKSCDKKFRSTHDLQRHKKVHESEGRYTCNSCKLSFPDHLSLNNHKQIHSEEKKHICQICKSEFLFKASLQRHEKSGHPEEMLFKCNECNQEFSSKNGLASHMVTHNRTKKYTCQFCPSEFLYKSSLDMHSKTEHPEQLFKCETCGKVFNTKKKIG